MSTHAIPNIQMCACCGYVMECATNITEGRKPLPGDVSLCMKCGKVHLFDERLNLVKATEADMDRLRGVPGVMQDIRRAQLAVLIASGKAVVITRQQRGRHVDH